MNRALPFLYGGSLGITLTVPLSSKILLFKSVHCGYRVQWMKLSAS